MVVVRGEGEVWVRTTVRDEGKGVGDGDGDGAR